MKQIKKYVINMPQMALEALSENWLLKELGDTHWGMLCKGLNTPSFDLRNDTNDRLYATFVRIRFKCSENIKAFKENDSLTLRGEIKRFGNNMYFSTIQAKSNVQNIEADLMTSFSIRNETDNTRLVKSEPNTETNTIEKTEKLPVFGNEYRLIKKNVLKTLNFENYDFQVFDGEKPIFQTIYTLNAFYDLNGVNLLYFAAYPIINDVCEAQYFNNLDPNVRWEQTFYTAYKDILYYGNCNINDKIIYKLLSCEKVSSTIVKMSSVLIRESDKGVLARIFSIKSSTIST
jgi:probable biosynthetic protein (TIGR04098 family)